MDGGRLPPEVIKSATHQAVAAALGAMPRDAFCADWLTGLMVGHPSYQTDGFRASVEKMLRPMNAVAKAFREAGAGRGGFSSSGGSLRAETALRNMPDADDLLKAGAVAKADLDVGTLTNFANITGGQSLGYVSLDTQMARGTVRPDSFTLYQALRKTAAFQVVDYWSYASDTGGGLPGTAFQSYSNVGTGTLTTNAGVYNLNNITLKLAVDGRAITTALAAQNSFVDVSAQENINAALNVLTSVDWSCYYGNPSLYANQFAGLDQTLLSSNTFDFQTFYNQFGSAAGWTSAQTLFNLIYVAVAQIATYPTFGRPTHAFMAPNTMASLQSQVTTLLNNIVNKITDGMTGSPIVVNGDFRGMMTRFGEVAFPMDLFISARNKPAAAIYNSQGVSLATLTNPTPPAAVSAVVVTGTVSGSVWGGAYVAASSSGIYSYAVASTDASSNESYLTYITSLSVSGIAASGAYNLTIYPPNDTTAIAYRVYRSGLGYAPASSGAANPDAYRYIGSVAANGASSVSFRDLNTKIPGSEDVWLLDLDDRDDALDFRFLLPLTRVELFAQNLFMPWAVTMIGAIRNKIPKFHGVIRNYVPDTGGFNPLSANASDAN